MTHPEREREIEALKDLFRRYRGGSLFNESDQAKAAWFYGQGVRVASGGGSGPLYNRIALAAADLVNNDGAGANYNAVRATEARVRLRALLREAGFEISGYQAASPPAAGRPRGDGQ